MVSRRSILAIGARLFRRSVLSAIGFPNSRARHEVYHAILSFGDDELSCDAEGIQKALEIGHSFAAEAWPSRQVFGVAQRDGEGAKTHIHFAVGNLDMVTGKAARGDEMRWKLLAPLLDSVLLDHGQRQPDYMPEGGQIPDFKRRGHTKYQHEKIVSGEDPRLKIIDAVKEAKLSATTLDEYTELLKSKGIKAELTAPHARKKYGAAKYSAFNPDGEECVFTGSRLGKGAGFRAVEAAVESNRAQLAKVSQATLEHVGKATAAALKSSQRSREGVAHDRTDGIQVGKKKSKNLVKDLSPARAQYLLFTGRITKEEAQEFGA